MTESFDSFNWDMVDQHESIVRGELGISELVTLALGKGVHTGNGDTIRDSYPDGASICDLFKHQGYEGYLLTEEEKHRLVLRLAKSYSPRYMIQLIEGQRREGYFLTNRQVDILLGSMFKNLLDIPEIELFLRKTKMLNTEQKDRLTYLIQEPLSKKKKRSKSFYVRSERRAKKKTRKIQKYWDQYF